MKVEDCRRFDYPPRDNGRQRGTASGVDRFAGPHHEKRRAALPIMAFERNHRYFLFKASICLTRVSISSGVSLPAYFGIRPLPLVIMLRRSSADADATFSDTNAGPPKCRPPAVLPWHFAQ